MTRQENNIIQADRRLAMLIKMARGRDNKPVKASLLHELRHYFDEVINDYRKLQASNEALSRSLKAAIQNGD